MPSKTISPLGKLEKVFELVDDKFGPIGRIVGVKPAQTQPPWWVFHAQLTRPLGQYFVDYECDAWGASIDKNEALFRCLGECLERYCMNCSHAMDQIEERVASDCKFFEQLPKCGPEEKCPESFKGVQSDWNLSQVRVTDVVTGDKHWFPAQFVHFSFKPNAGEKRIAISHSSGSAFHETLHQAIWSGLCEVAERDAFSLFWLNQFPAVEIEVDDDFDDCRVTERKRRLERLGLKARWFDITTDFNVPTVFAMVTGNEFPRATFGASCSEDPIKAICKAMDEVNLIRVAQLSGKDTAHVPSYEEFSWVHSLRDHADLYALWEDPPSLDFFINDKTPKQSLSAFVSRPWWRCPERYSQLQDFCALLEEKHGMNVLYSDHTLDDVAHFGFGVKTIVPQMVPISVLETAKWLGVPRIVQHAQRHNLRPASNPYPHPFP